MTADGELRLDTRVPFTPKQGRAAGIDRATLLGPGYHKVLHGLYVSAATPITLELRARGLLDLLDDDAHLSHHTAAALWGLWVPHHPDLHVCRAPGRRHSRPGVSTHHCACHGGQREPGQVFRRGGLPLTSPVGTFFELAETLGLIDLVVLGDSLVRAGRVTPRDLVEQAAGSSRRGARRAREAAAFVRAGVDSPMETRLRLLLVLAGLPEPRVNLALTDGEGNVRRRLDLAYDQWRVAVEYDGRQHKASDEEWHGDIVRRDDLTSEGWRFVVVLSRGVYGEPSVTVDRVGRALRDAGWDGVRTPHPDWRRLFPGY